MTTELALLLGLCAFIMAGAFFSDYGPFSVFGKSGPRLGARIEREITIGRGFKVNGGTVRQWKTPPGNAPDGTL